MSTLIKLAAMAAVGVASYGAVEGLDKYFDKKYDEYKDQAKTESEKQTIESYKEKSKRSTYFTKGLVIGAAAVCITSTILSALDE